MISRYDQLEAIKSAKGGTMKKNIVVVDDDQIENDQKKQGCCGTS